jgi:hypothetical protein
MKANAVIENDQMQAVLSANQADSRILRAGVPVNIGQGFLRQAIDCCFDGCGSCADVRNFRFHFETGALGKAIGKILEGNRKAIRLQ